MKGYNSTSTTISSETVVAGPLLLPSSPSSPYHVFPGLYSIPLHPYSSKAEQRIACAMKLVLPEGAQQERCRAPSNHSRRKSNKTVIVHMNIGNATVAIRDKMKRWTHCYCCWCCWKTFHSTRAEPKNQERGEIPSTRLQDEKNCLRTPSHLGSTPRYQSGRCKRRILSTCVRAHRRKKHNRNHNG